MNYFSRISLLTVFTFILYVLKMPSNGELMPTLFTVTGILFSIGLSLIITLDLSNIRASDIYDRIKENLDIIRNRYILLFSITTLCFIISETIKNNQKSLTFHIYNEYRLSIDLLFCSLSLALLIYTMIYFVLNFLEIQKLKDDINNKIQEEKET